MNAIDYTTLTNRITNMPQDLHVEFINMTKYLHIIPRYMKEPYNFNFQIGHRICTKML